jgi:hypothetical protein
MSADHSGFISANLTLDMVHVPYRGRVSADRKPACPDALLIDVLISANFC